MTRLLQKLTNYSGMDEESMKQLHIDFRVLGVKVSYESFKTVDVGHPRRVIFSTGRRTPNELTSETNGAVMIQENGKWRPLVIPGRTLRTDINSRFTDANLDNFDIYHINEGTCINLYAWDSEAKEESNPWRISTTKGYDMTQVKWAGKKTYLDVLHEVLQATGHDPDAFFKSLDPAQSYTFGFRHPDFHPWQDEHTMWFIQRATLDGGEINYDLELDGIDIPGQTPVNVQQLKVLFRSLGPALDKYLKGEKPNFGYILRKKPGVVMNAEHHHMLLESSLLRAIRSMFYSSTLTQTATKFGYDREKYIVIKAFLTANSNKTFFGLFPRYKKHSSELIKISKKLVKSILLRYKGRSSDATAQSAIKRLDTKYANASAHALRLIDAKKTLTIQTPGITRAVTTFILAPEFLPVFYDLASF
jgi:hypothetical protein